MTKVLDGTLAKVVAAYDNELGNSRWGGDMVTSRGKWLVEGTVDPHCLRVVLECLLACHYVACDNAREPTMGQRQVVTVPQIRTNEAGPSDPRRATALLNVLIEAIQEHAASITYVFSISRFFRISSGPPTQTSTAQPYFGCHPEEPLTNPKCGLLSWVQRGGEWPHCACWSKAIRMIRLRPSSQQLKHRMFARRPNNLTK